MWQLAGLEPAIGFSSGAEPCTRGHMVLQCRGSPVTTLWACTCLLVGIIASTGRVSATWQSDMDHATFLTCARELSSS